MLSKIVFIFVMIFTFFSNSDSNFTSENKFLDTESTPNIGSINEQLLSLTENAYNPIPSPDGKMIAYVETGWNRERGSGGSGRSNLKSNIKLMDTNGKIQSEKPLADAFLNGWTSDGKNLIAFRDWHYFILPIEGTSIEKELEPNYSFFEESDKEINLSERVAYLEKENLFLWIRNEYAKQKSSYTSTFISSAIKTQKGDFLSFKESLNTESMLIPSPNERYIAMIGTATGSPKTSLKIYDRNNETWTNLGKITIHPDKEWDYIKPSWNPWFADSSKLVFISDNGIVISSPDGKDKKIISKEKNNIGLAVPSPDGKNIGYVSFKPRPKKIRRDLDFFGDTIIWVIDSDGKIKPQAITYKNENETYSLHWINNQEVVFDRIADEISYKKAQLWKATFLKK